MCARLPCSTSTGCVASAALECVWTAIDYAGTSPGRVRQCGSIELTNSLQNSFYFIFYCSNRIMLIKFTFTKIVQSDNVSL